MAAHLARHQAAAHGKGASKAKAARKAKADIKVASVADLLDNSRGGRPPAVIKQFNLPGLTTDQLDKLIRAAISELHRRLEMYRQAIGG